MSTEKLKSSKEITPGPIIPRPATSLDNKTGSWRSSKPILKKDKCTGCLICWILCPEGSIKRKKIDNRYQVIIDYEYCKGCGICATECPVKAVEMERE